jgi:putative transposase
VSTSESAVSRRFVAATETALAALLAVDLSGLDLVALMVDGVHVGEHCGVVALGIDIDGTKHPLSLVEGSIENATMVGELVVGLRERGLNVTRPLLVVIDGSKAHAAACEIVRPPGDRMLPVTQDPQCRRPAAQEAALGRREADASRLPRRDRPGCSSPVGGTGWRAGRHPPQRGGVAA